MDVEIRKMLLRDKKEKREREGRKECVPGGVYCGNVLHLMKLLPSPSPIAPQGLHTFRYFLSAHFNLSLNNTILFPQQ
jgi:hypothetical protein